MDSLIPVLVITVLIGLNGLFVAAEFAIIGAPRLAIEGRARDGERVARLVRHIVSDNRRQDRYIATAQIGITLASLGLGMYGEHVLAAALVPHLERYTDWPWLPAHAVASVVAITVLTYFHIVVGEMVPKTFALQHAEKTALAVTPAMQAMQTLFYPLVVGLNAAGDRIIRAMGLAQQTPAHERYFTPDELQVVIEESRGAGLLPGEAGHIVQEILEFGELTAGTVMVPRVQVVGLPLGVRDAGIADRIQQSAHTRYPVYDGSLDQIVGFVHITDLLRRVLDGGAVEAADVGRLPAVPTTALLDRVLATMKEESTPMVLVIDEYGGTAGILTLEDLFSEVVPASTALAAGSPASPAGQVRVSGTTRVEEVGERFSRVLAHPDVDSVSGLVMTLLGRPPQVGDVVIWSGLRFTVTAVRGLGIAECLIEPVTDARE